MAAEQVAEGVWIVRGGPGHCNVYLVREGDGVLAFDAGARRMHRAITQAADELGGLTRVVLGHGHTDHRGAAPFLPVPVLCHPDARADAEGSGGRDYWDPKLRFLALPLRPVHMALHRWVWDGGPVQIAGTVQEGDEIGDGFRAVLVDGHAPGQIALWRERDRVAITSDAFYVVDMWGRSRAPVLPIAGYSQDPARAARSLARLADLRPALCLPGHGAAVTDHPTRGTVEEQLRAAAREGEPAPT